MEYVFWYFVIGLVIAALNEGIGFHPLYRPLDLTRFIIGTILWPVTVFVMIKGI